MLANDELVSTAIGKALDKVAERLAPLAAVSSIARGADTLFVEEVARRKLPFFLLLPFPVDRFKKDFDDIEWQRVDALIPGALDVEVLAPGESDQEAYLETGLLTVERADVMIAVLDPDHPSRKGGTQDVVDYARAVEKPLIVINPKTGDVENERLNQLPVQAAPTTLDGDRRQSVVQELEEIDQEARQHAPRARQLFLRIVVLHLVSTALAISAIVLQPFLGSGAARRAVECVATTLEVAFLGRAFYLALRHHRTQARWLENRIRSELCRSALATWGLRRHLDLRPRIAVKGFARLCANLRMAELLDRRQDQTVEQLAASYAKNRIRDQIDYFTRKGREARDRYRGLKGLAISATAAAILSSVLGFALTFFGVLHEDDLALAIIKLASLLLPLLNAALFTLIVSQDYSRRVARYGEMVELLEALEKRLQTPPTWPSLSRVVQETEQLLMQEVVEWYSFARFAGEPH